MPLLARGPRRPSADLCTLVKWGPASPPPPPQVLTISDSEIWGPSATALTRPIPVVRHAVFKKPVSKFVWNGKLLGGIGLGREGLHETHTHAQHTARTRRPGAGVQGQEEESWPAPSPQAPQPLPVVRVETEIWGQPLPCPAVPLQASDTRRFPVAWRRGFVRVVLLAQAGRWAGRGQKKNLSSPEAGDQASKHTMQKCKPTGDTPTHSPTRSHAILPSSSSEDETPVGHPKCIACFCSV